MTFLGLTKTQRKMIQFEVITERARLQLTRLIRGVTKVGRYLLHFFRETQDY